MFIVGNHEDDGKCYIYLYIFKLGLINLVAKDYTSFMNFKDDKQSF